MAICLPGLKPQKEVGEECEEEEEEEQEEGEEGEEKLFRKKEVHRSRTMGNNSSTL